MAFELSDLPFGASALAPWISEETLDFHHGHHDRAYVEKLNSLVSGTRLEDRPLEQLILEEEGVVGEYAAQVWNHSLYWNCLAPLPLKRTPIPKTLQTAIQQEYGSIDGLRVAFCAAAMALFGSGWTWLVRDPSGRLQVLSTSNADNPLRMGLVPILVCDVWEHAYYIDYRNTRAKYLTAFWMLIDWAYVFQRFSAPEETLQAKKSRLSSLPVSPPHPA